MLVAISGIDAAGKVFVTEQFANALQNQDVRVATINVDGWLNLPSRRFAKDNAAEHFYLHAIRFEEMFRQLVLPLRDGRSWRVEADFAEETDTQYRKHIYQFERIDVILLEGIYLLKRAFQPYYDVSVWIDCSFETALERALMRAQEGLNAEETTRAYRDIYFPAQLIHFERDDPRATATMILPNDPRLSGR